MPLNAVTTDFVSEAIEINLNTKLKKAGIENYSFIDGTIEYEDGNYRINILDTERNRYKEIVINTETDIKPLIQKKYEVKPKLEQEIVQYDVLRGKNLSETYSRMLDNIIGLPYIKG
jgi:hypothetical protein